MQYTAVICSRLNFMIICNETRVICGHVLTDK